MRRYSLHTLFFCLISFALLVSCSKTDGDGGGGGGGNNTPTITGFSPNNVTTGGTVTITGTNFGTNLGAVVVHLGSVSFAASVVNGNTITFTVPSNLISSGSAIFTLYVVVNGVTSNTIQVTVSYVYQEPHGWRYINKDMVYGPGLVSDIYFMDDPYKFGLAFSRGHLSNTSDDGASWGGIWPSNHWGGGFHVYDQDEAWIETNTYDLWVYDYDYFNASAFYARIDTITTIPFLQGKAINAAYIIKRNRGYIITHDGSVFKIKGSFKPSDISLEYQPSVYTSLPLTYDNNNFYAFSGADSSNFMIAGRPKINNVMTPMIIHKRNGVYKEYFFTVNDIGYPYRVECPDANNAYFTSLSFELFKYNVSTDSWTKLNTPKFNDICFVSGTTGYATSAWEPGVHYFHIYKTTDGGLNWNVVFSLDRDHLVYNLFSKNGKVWALGEEINFHKNFLVKFNP